MCMRKYEAFPEVFVLQDVAYSSQVIDGPILYILFSVYN